MTDEWTIVRHYIGRLVRDAPTALRVDADALLAEYLKTEAELAAARKLMSELIEAGATIESIADPLWQRFRERYGSFWRDAFSEAAKLELRIIGASRRGRAKNIDHAGEYEIGFDAFRRSLFGEAKSIRAAILAEAQDRNIVFRNPNEKAAYVKRISRFINGTDGPKRRLTARVKQVLRDKRS